MSQTKQGKPAFAEKEIRVTLIPCSTERNAAMANLTITVDDELLKKARIRALEQGTSVNALLREYLMAYAGHNEMQEAIAAFLEIAKNSPAGSGPQGRTWTRDDAHER